MNRDTPPPSGMNPPGPPPDPPPQTKTRRHVGLGVLLLAAVVLYLYAAWPRPAHPMWASDLQAALQRAEATRRPVLVEFQASWCGPCEWMGREVFPRPEVVRALKDWISVQIDVDAQPQIAGRYGVEALPTFIVLADDGRELRRYAGAFTADEFVAFLKRAASPAATTQSGS